jgi:hypothetical protein
VGIEAPAAQDLVQAGVSNGNLRGQRSRQIVLLHQLVDLILLGHSLESLIEVELPMGDGHGHLVRHAHAVELVGPGTHLGVKRLLAS